ncbi:DUF2934 domain-containing protein [Jiella pacifica]|uniref:DUF2934 domain-containing protein n=1 Tax=Jiella pacifica TaxID=2696469 RepID=A0A6N9T4V9_9HYPH|nr:DUF2934 domain-containing protein [Jiella pacifica]NDW05235.1 DUF2934 domain-containing protein [Jiella pacifica]
MPRIDDAAEIRALAYQIWEQEGCPSGREHEHWAQANRIYAQLHPAEPNLRESRGNDMEVVSVGRSEIDRLRQALWTPEPFSPDLYPNSVPEPRPVWQRQGMSPEVLGSRATSTRPARRVGSGRY